MIQLLNSDLTNEYTHLLFYLHHAATVTGLHRPELQEFLLKQAKSEMNHVHQFSNLILGLDGIPEVSYSPFQTFFDSAQILDEAILLESMAVDNYAVRIEQANDLGGIDGKTVALFLEEQMLDSRRDLDHMRRMVARI